MNYIDVAVSAARMIESLHAVPALVLRLTDIDDVDDDDDDDADYDDDNGNGNDDDDDDGYRDDDDDHDNGDVDDHEVTVKVDGKRMTKMKVTGMKSFVDLEFDNNEELC